MKRILGPDYVTSNDVKSDPEDRIIFSDESEKEDNWEKASSLYNNSTKCIDFTYFFIKYNSKIKKILF